MKENVELIIKFTADSGEKHTIKFDLSEIDISQSRDVITTYNADGSIHERKPENKVNLTVKGVIKKNYEN
jgi:hypothetical protein